MLAGNVELAAPLEAMVIYNAAAEDRATGPVEKSWTVDTVADTVLEVVGAGGIGVHLLESLAPMLGHGCELRIFDPDDVGVENIPLQTPYAISDVGCPKAVVIAKKLKQINPALRIRPIPIVYQDRPQHLSCPSARVVCADNWAVRYFANQISVSDGIPLVEAGSSTLAAQQRTYHLGITACLEHRIHNLTEKAAKEKKPESCSRSTALTLPGTNMIIGGILAAEVLKTLDTKRFGFPSRGTITYDARVLRRLGIMDVHPPCEHETHIEANNS